MKPVDSISLISASILPHRRTPRKFYSSFFFSAVFPLIQTCYYDRYFGTSRMMSPGYRTSGVLSPRIEEKSGKFEIDMHQTPRQNENLGKHAYSLAFGNSDLSKILVNNKGQKLENPLNDLMRKSLNQEENLKGTAEVIVPRDFLIKTAYVRKRRNKLNDQASTRSRGQSSIVSAYSKLSKQFKTFQ